MKISDLSPRSNAANAVWWHRLLSSRYTQTVIISVALISLLWLHRDVLSFKPATKKHQFKNAQGEEVPAEYFKNKKGKKAKAARVRNPWARVDRVSVLGERNSGTRWMTKELQRCFPQVKVGSSLQRWKHWFQEDDGQEHLTTLVVAQFRDPYFWAEAMRHVPHHAPNHLGLKDDWKAFMTKPWTLGYRPKRDLTLRRKDKEGICYENFNYNELESCVEGSSSDPEYQAMFDKTTGLNQFGFSKDDPHDFKADKPMYELQRDGSAKPFANLMDMRTAKILNFLEIKDWNWVKDLVVVQYEQMLALGTESLIAQIENITTYKGVTQLKRNCTPAEPQQRSKRLLNPDLIDWISDTIDWRAEGLIGYQKLPKQTKEDMDAYLAALEPEKGEDETDIEEAEEEEGADEEEEEEDDESDESNDNEGSEDHEEEEEEEDGNDNSEEDREGQDNEEDSEDGEDDSAKDQESEEDATDKEKDEEKKSKEDKSKKEKAYDHDENEDRSRSERDKKPSRAPTKKTRHD